MKTNDTLILALVDAAELVQKCQRICDDTLLRWHIHAALLELTKAIAEAAPRKVQVEPEELWQ